MNTRKIFLNTLIASVALSAVLGIVVVIAGSFGEFELRVLMTTLTVTATSILGLACGACYEAGRGRKLPLAGIVLSVVSALALFLIIWNVLDDNETYIKTTMTLVIGAIVASHLSLLRLARLDRRFAWSYPFAAACDLLHAAIILYLMWFEPEGESDLVFRTIGVLSILIAAVTVITPVFHRLSAGETDIEKIDVEINELKLKIEELEKRKSEALNKQSEPPG
ncbi:MAG: hypothetical protein IPM21_09060 [Acidobacteria bacterium]|nr:hypothetical protein [Acidobacteriota bacterium]